MLSRRRFVLAGGALLISACQPGGVFATHAVAGDVARPGLPGVAEPVRVRFALARPASVEATLRGPTGSWTLRESTPRVAGEEYEIAFDGTVPAAQSDRMVLPDGAYELRLAADGEERVTSVRVEAADHVPLELNGPALSVSTITPDGDGVQDEVRIDFKLGKSANVEIWAQDPRGIRATILRPGSRSAGDHTVTWDGSAGGRVFGGKRLFDGQYVLTLRAWDDAGNVRQRETPLRIANGGIERLEIAEVSMTPTRVRRGETLRVRIKVVNTGETEARTMGPPPTTRYRTSESFSTMPGVTPVSGAWRVGIGWPIGQELPLRWGLLQDPRGTLAPGAEAIVEADVVVELDPHSGMRFWAAVIREGVGIVGGRVGDHLVEVFP